MLPVQEHGEEISARRGKEESTAKFQKTGRVVLDFLFDHFDDDLAFSRLAHVDRRSAVNWREIGALELGDAEDVFGRRAAN